MAYSRYQPSIHKEALRKITQSQSQQPVCWPRYKPEHKKQWSDGLQLQLMTKRRSLLDTYLTVSNQFL